MGIDDLIVLASKRGVEALAITDKDCQAGIIRAKMAGERKGITIIPGVEISCLDRKRNQYADILCYLPDSPDRLEGLFRQNLMAKKRANQLTTLKISKKYPLSAELLSKCATGSTCVYEHHIIHALFECGYTDRIYGDLYNELFSPDSPDNVLTMASYADPAAVIEEIHNAGGIAVLAHPGKYGNFELFEELMGKGLDGVEVWCPSNNDEVQRFLLEKAKGTELLLIGGSEFMGMYNETTVSVGEVQTPEANVKALMNYKTKMKKRKTAAAKAK